MKYILERKTEEHCKMRTIDVETRDRCCSCQIQNEIITNKRMTKIIFIDIDQCIYSTSKNILIIFEQQIQTACRVNNEVVDGIRGMGGWILRWGGM